LALAVSCLEQYPMSLEVRISRTLTQAAVDLWQAQVRVQIGLREAAWRTAHPEHPQQEPLPAEVRNRDVVWKALERKLQRA